MNKNKERGFTLAEMMIVVIIISIIIAIAFPSYQKYVLRGRRVAAAACLMEASQYMERFYTANLRYDQTRTTAVAVDLPNMECRNNLADFYDIDISSVSTMTYSLDATPLGVQASGDTKCGTLSIDDRGLRAVSGDEDVNGCW